MKVIGMQDENYIAVISHYELEKAADLYYGKMKRLKVGDEHPIGLGHDFRSEIKGACQQMVAVATRSAAAQKTLLDFALMVAKQSESA